MNIFPRYIAVVFFLFSMVVSAVVGFYFGTQSEKNAQNEPDGAEIDKGLVGQVADEVGRGNQNKSGITVEELAKQKAVPAMIPNSGGDYTLVSVVEGGPVNQKLTENLQLVTLQRRQLNSLAKQFEQTPVSAVQQRELIAGQLNEVRAALQGNLQFMAKNYAYRLDHIYLRVPHQVSLIGSKQVDGKTVAEVIHEFKTADDYLVFQKKNDAYMKAELESSKALDEVSENGGHDGSSEETALPATLKSNENLASMRDELIRNYNFYPEQKYNLQYMKTALYARPAK